MDQVVTTAATLPVRMLEYIGCHHLAWATQEAHTGCGNAATDMWGQVRLWVLLILLLQKCLTGYLFLETILNI